MRALTVRQPWAWAIVHGGKGVENRTRNIAGAYRGPVAIHAGLQVDQGGIDHELLRPEWATGGGWAHVAEGMAEISYPTSDDRCTPNRLAAVVPLGAFVGVVDLVDVHWSGMECSRGVVCHEYELCSAWGQAYHHHLVLANPRPLAAPIPARGRLGLWTPDPAVVEQLQEVTSA